MTMTVDEALKEVVDGWQPTGECGRVLAAEVERVRDVLRNVASALCGGSSSAENIALREENSRMREALGEEMATKVIKGDL